MTQFEFAFDEMKVVPLPPRKAAATRRRAKRRARSEIAVFPLVSRAALIRTTGAALLAARDVDARNAFWHGLMGDLAAEFESRGLAAAEINAQLVRFKGAVAIAMAAIHARSEGGAA